MNTGAIIRTFLNFYRPPPSGRIQRPSARFCLGWGRWIRTIVPGVKIPRPAAERAPKLWTLAAETDACRTTPGTHPSFHQQDGGLRLEDRRGFPRESPQVTSNGCKPMPSRHDSTGGGHRALSSRNPWSTVGQVPQEKAGRSWGVEIPPRSWESSSWPPVTFAIPEDASPAMHLSVLAACMYRMAVNTDAPVAGSTSDES